MVNRAILLGRLGADPEMKDTKSGTKVANLRLATNERAKVDGEWGEHTEWHRVVCFGKTAENVGRYLEKGAVQSRRPRGLIARLMMTSHSRGQRGIHRHPIYRAAGS